VEQQLGVSEATVSGWETNSAQPGVKYMPANRPVPRCNPLPPAPRGMGDRLVRCRTLLGLSQKVFAGQLEVDQGTLAKWERGDRVPAGAFAARVSRFLTTEAA